MKTYNFSAGPASLPKEVIGRIRNELLSDRRFGVPLLDLSHRSRPITEVLDACKTKLMELLGLSADTVDVLLLHGGASTVFYQVPMNLFPADKTGVANYIETGYWVQKAITEARRFGHVHLCGSSKKEGFRCLVPANQLNYHPQAIYTYLCSNNTLYGTQWPQFPQNLKGYDVPLVGDFSSDFLCRQVDLSSFGIMFASAQKNLGTPGLAVMVIRKDVLDRCREDLPPLCSYKVISKHKSLYNTPPLFAIHVFLYMLEWIEDQGGLSIIEKHNRQKASLLYDALEAYSLYHLTADKDVRSLMNVTFTLPSASLTKTFLEDAEKQGFIGLKGHREVGGIRASIYNAFPTEGVERFIYFLEEFGRRHS